MKKISRITESHWLYRGEKYLEISSTDIFGFVYKILNLKNNRYYIGRKNFYSTNRKKVVGKTRRTVITKESNWKVYTGSNDLLNEDIKKLGKDNFKFEILGFAYTKGQLSFLEEHIQHRLAVIVDENAYNDAIGSGSFRSVKIDDRLRDSIKNIEL